jgi:hypothetical protein
MNIGITVYPTYGGSGIVGSEIGREMAENGHNVHFISSALPTRLIELNKRVHFHEVEMMNYPLFEHQPYDLALATKMATVMEHLPAKLPTYEMPLDGREMGGIDYHYTGDKHIELQGHKLVDVGGKYLIVDALGRPYVSDLDLATRQRPGLSNAGDHIDPKLKKAGALEDSPILEWEMNQLYHKLGGHPTHNPTNHGGAGATAVYTREGIKAGKKPGVDNFWTPKTADGYKQERLVIFIPEWNGRTIRSQMYVLNSWADFKAFARENNLEFPW